MNELLDSKEKALAWLYQEELHNLMSIDMLERDRLRITYAGTGSLLLEQPETMMIHCKVKEEWPELLAVLLKDLDPAGFCILKAHEAWYLDELMEKTGFTDLGRAYNGTFPPGLELAGQDPAGLEIRPLTMAEFPIVRKVYQTVDDDDYIRERIEAGMLGAWYQGELAGFMGTHEDGSMGLLEVLPPYRRLGISRALERKLIRTLREKGLRPYGNIFAENELSLAIHKKAGVLVSKEPVYWLFRPAE